MSGFDFDAHFVSVDSQEAGAEFEVMNDAGEPTGLFIRLAGPGSKRRKKAKARLMDFIWRNGIGGAGGPRKGRKGGESYTGDLATQFSDLQMDDLVAATISWRFPKGAEGPECTPENVREIYAKHSTLLEQVAAAADDLDRFMKA